MYVTWMRQNVNVPSETSNAHICWVLYIDDTNGMVQPAYRWIIPIAQVWQRWMDMFMWNMAQSVQSRDWFAISIMLLAVYFKSSYCYDCFLFVQKKNLKNKTVTTKIAYAALFLWIVLCSFRFCLLQFSVLTRKKKCSIEIQCCFVY